MNGYIIYEIDKTSNNFQIGGKQYEEDSKYGGCNFGT